MQMNPTSVHEDPPSPALGSTSHSEHRFQGFPSDHRIPSFTGGGSGVVMAKYKMMSPARLPITRSPCTTITITSPGFSPGALLESPVLLNNVKAEPSPTTGTFFIPSVFHCSVGSETSSSPKESSNSSTNDEGTSGMFEFKPHPKSCLGTALPGGNSHFINSNDQQTERSAQCWSQNQHPHPHQPFSSSYHNQPVDNGTASHELTLFASSNQVIEASSSTAATPQEIASSEMDQEKRQENDCQTQMDSKVSDSSAVEKTSEDGYNWRKYGQKHVKGSEFPRSYYKCTHPNCQMKKQLERSHDGQITDIIYKGSHDHPKPQPTRRSAAGTLFYSQEEEKVDGFTSLVSMEEDKSLQIDGQVSHSADLDGPKEFVSSTTNEDDIEGASVQLTNGSDIADDEDPESKRRRTENTGFDTNPMANKINREPRVVVQTLSEVDILDDGYRWRKYGQKVVKGNPNPRSYYKCTNVGCPVRKHVERASHDPKAVITTYEGKHNHDVPAAKTSSHDTALLMPLSDNSSRGSQIPASFPAIPRTFDNTRHFQHHQYNMQVESDTISLDLGVGLSPRQREIANDTNQTSRPEQQIPNTQGHITSSIYGHSVMQVSHGSPYYGGPNDAMVYMGPRDDISDGFSFKSVPLNNSSNPYHTNIGSLLMGP